MPYLNRADLLRMVDGVLSGGPGDPADAKHDAKVYFGLLAALRKHVPDEDPAESEFETNEYAVEWGFGTTHAVDTLEQAEEMLTFYRQFSSDACIVTRPYVAGPGPWRPL